MFLVQTSAFPEREPADSIDWVLGTAKYLFPSPFVQSSFLGA
jgi:hypothetical protein